LASPHLVPQVKHINTQR